VVSGSRFRIAEEGARTFLMPVAKGKLRLLPRIYRLIPASQVSQIGQSGLAVE
jgi:hypothetical protein